MMARRVATDGMIARDPRRFIHVIAHARGAPFTVTRKLKPAPKYSTVYLSLRSLVILVALLFST